MGNFVYLVGDKKKKECVLVDPAWDVDAILKEAEKDGMKVVASGRITVYEPRGAYQLDAQFMRPLGVGDLQIAFEKLKQKLAAEGLFDAERKKPLPEFPPWARRAQWKLPLPSPGS